MAPYGTAWQGRRGVETSKGPGGPFSKEGIMEYRWKIPKYEAVPAQAAGEHIEELEALHGKVTPRLLLDDSRPAGAVLHPLYEWDDHMAAEKYRLGQSGDIVRNLVIVRPVEVEEEARAVRVVVREEAVEVRAFTSVEEDGVRAYKSTSAVVADEELWLRAVEDIQASIRSLKEKYSGMSGFRSAWQEALAKEGMAGDG